MKKIFLLMILLVLGMAANAIDWVSVDTNIPNFYLYVDKDSIKNVNPQEYLYAIKFQAGNKNEKAAFLKSNFQTNYMGIIRSDYFESWNYNPQSEFANVHVFMKPLNNDSFLSFAHNYVAKLFVPIVKNQDNDMVDKKSEAFPPEIVTTNENIVPKKDDELKNKPDIRGMDVNIHNGGNKKNNEILNFSQAPVEQSQKISNSSSLKEYVDEICIDLNKNWNPPKSGQNSQAIIILTIGKDGSLQKYDIAKSSGDELTDRSIITAAEKSVPYKKYSSMKNGADNIKLQFVFEYKKFKKSVI